MLLSSALTEIQVAVQNIQALPCISAIVLIGSYARNQQTTQSDIDLLIVTSNSIRLADLNALAQQACKKRVSVSKLSITQLNHHWRDWTLTAWYLKDQSVVLVDDGTIAELLKKPTPKARPYFNESRRELRKVAALFPLEKFRGDYSYVFSTLYGVFKNVALFEIASSGRLPESKYTAIDDFYGADPVLAKFTEKIHQLKYFYIHGDSKPNLAAFTNSDYQVALDLLSIVFHLRIKHE